MSKRIAVWLAVLAVLLAGCSSSPPKEEAQLTTERESLDRSARLAFAQGQYAQASTLYEAALDEALAEDLPEPIIDARFNLALANTYLGDYRSALEQVAQADAERVRRNLGPDPELDLLLATIHYRAGDREQAQAVLDRLLTGGALAPVAAAKAHFIAGLIAADRKDANALRAHLGALPPEAGTGIQADRLELQGRLATVTGERENALKLFDQTAALRGLERDYRGMVRALAAAGTLAEQSGQLGLAGDYLLRAGRSAAQRDESHARGWLERARDLGQRGGNSALVLEATTMLKMLDARE